MSTFRRSGRDALADALSASRVDIANRVSSRTGASDMLVRSFVTSLERSMREYDHAPIIDWLRVVKRSYPASIVGAAIRAACEDAIGVGERMSRAGEDVDLANVIVFLNIVERDIARTLEAREPGNARFAAPSHDIIEPVLAMLRARDEATCQHSLLTGDWCRRIAERLGLPSAETDRLVAAGVLHDIGKIATPDAILFKPGPLDASEWVVMREHAPDGGDILLDIPSLAEFAPIVRAHHERIDGTGYPDGLRGDEIPFSARIVAVADAYHAMTSDRPYRKALTVGETIARLREGQGTQWDTDIVDVMVGLAIESRNLASDADLRRAAGVHDPIVANASDAEASGM